MKNRQNNRHKRGKAVLLFYNLNGSRGEPWKNAARQCGIAIRSIAPSEYEKEIRTLLEEPPSPGTGPALGFADEMIVMASLPELTMDSFLRAAYAGGADRNVLKAVVTETNLMWTSYRLFMELKREREALSQANR